MTDDDLEQPSLFWDLVEGLVTMAMIIGILVSMCFMFGYLWYRP